MACFVTYPAQKNTIVLTFITLTRAITARVISSKKSINHLLKNLNPKTMQVVLEVAILIAVILVPLIPAKSSSHVAKH
jgi:hypothetical protein